MNARVFASSRWLLLCCAFTVQAAIACSDTATGGGTDGGVTNDTTTTSGPGSASGTLTSGDPTSSGTTSGLQTTTSGTTGAGMTATTSSGTTATSGSQSSTGSSTTGAGGATSTGSSSMSSGAGGTMSGAGGTSATGAGGTGGTSAQGFAPCPTEGPCKILPLGDSITFGLGFDGGYRVELFRLALADDHEITFTGTQSPNGPSMVEGVSFPRNHAGISGQTIDQIAGRIPNPDLMEMPHIVLLHAGTNDMVGNANGADQRLGSLMDKLIDQAPDALIVVSNIIPLSFGGGSVDSFNATVEPMVNDRAAQGAHIVFADQFADFPTNELGDGVHPNEAGYNRMARVWYEIIEPYLP